MYASANAWLHPLGCFADEHLGRSVTGGAGQDGRLLRSGGRAAVGSTVGTLTFEQVSPDGWSTGWHCTVRRKWSSEITVADRAILDTRADATDALQRLRAPSRRRMLEVLHAPNPTDIRWQFLEIAAEEKRRRTLQARVILLPALVVGVLGIVFAAYMQGTLRAAPIFLECVDSQPLAPDCDWPIGDRIGRNVLNFLWCTALTVASVHIVLQPILILSMVRDAHQSHTALMLSLFLRFLVWQVALTAVLSIVCATSGIVNSCPKAAAAAA